MVEFALILPIMLFVIIGGLGLGLLLLHRMQMQHAAQEVAIAVATANSDCSIAEARTEQILKGIDKVECKATGLLVEITLTNSFPVLVPGLPDTIVVSSRSFQRESPEPSPSST